MNTKFEVVSYDEYFERFEVNIYKNNCEEPETEYLRVKFDPEFEEEVEKCGEFFVVLDEWMEKGKKHIIGFEYEGKTYRLDDENVKCLEL